MRRHERTKAAITLLWILGLLLGAALVGCAAPGNGSPGASSDTCAKAKAAYAQAQAVVDAADRAVIAEQQALAALPANDPIRKQLEPGLTRAAAFLTEVQIAAQLARIGVAALCPEIPTPTVVLPPAAPGPTTPTAATPTPTTQPGAP